MIQVNDIRISDVLTEHETLIQESSFEVYKCLQYKLQQTQTNIQNVGPKKGQQGPQVIRNGVRNKNM